MVSVPVEQMLELWCVELRQVKAHLKSLFAHPVSPSRQGPSSMACSGLSGARPAGCGPKPREIQGRGASRRCSAAATGTQMPCGTWCATMRSRRWPHPVRC